MPSFFLSFSSWTSGIAVGVLEYTDDFINLLLENAG